MNSGSNQPLRPALGTAVGMALVISLAAAGIQAAEPVQSEWIFPGSNGKLVYKTTPTGDKIVDFSHAGYMGGGVALPVVPVRRTLEPSGSDDETAAIQRMPRPFADGPLLPEGIKDSHGRPVTLRSLYLAQLAERLGPQALKNIGYEQTIEEAYESSRLDIVSFGDRHRHVRFRCKRARGFGLRQAEARCG